MDLVCIPDLELIKVLNQVYLPCLLPIYFLFRLMFWQIFAYAMMSAGSAASGVTNLNRTGIQHSSLPNFCKPLHIFCTRVAVSIAFTFFSFFLLALTAVIDVVWLSKY